VDEDNPNRIAMDCKVPFHATADEIAALYNYLIQRYKFPHSDKFVVGVLTNPATKMYLKGVFMTPDGHGGLLHPTAFGTADFKNANEWLVQLFWQDANGKTPMVTLHIKGST